MTNSQKAFEELLKSQPYFNFLTGNSAMKFGFEAGFKAAIEVAADIGASLPELNDLECRYIAEEIRKRGAE